MDIVAHLTQEHRKVEDLLDHLASTDIGDEREELVDQLLQAFDLHQKVEEQFLYPIVASVAGDETETEAETEHRLAWEGLQKLEALQSEPGFGAALEMVRAGISHHVEEEEGEIFPQLQEEAAAALAALDPQELEAQVRQGASSGSGRGGSGPRGGSGQGGDALIDLSRDELYERAKEAGIPGRSSMSKDELLDALSRR